MGKNSIAGVAEERSIWQFNTWCIMAGVQSDDDDAPEEFTLSEVSGVCCGVTFRVWGFAALVMDYWCSWEAWEWRRLGFRTRLGLFAIGGAFFFGRKEI